MKIKKKIINDIYELNTLTLIKKKTQNETSFYAYISDVIRNSHFTVKLLYEVVIYKIIFIYLILFIFLLGKKKQRLVLKFVLKIFGKFYLIKNIFKLLRVYSIMYYYE